MIREYRFQILAVIFLILAVLSGAIAGTLENFYFNFFFVSTFSSSTIHWIAGGYEENIKSKMNKSEVFMSSFFIMGTMVICVSSVYRVLPEALKIYGKEISLIVCVVFLSLILIIGKKERKIRSKVQKQN